MYLGIHLFSSVGIMLLKLVEILQCAKILNETSHRLGGQRIYCFINSLNLAKADDIYGRVLKKLSLIVKIMIPEVAGCFSYLKEV